MGNPCQNDVGGCWRRVKVLVRLGFARLAGGQAVLVRDPERRRMWARGYLGRQTFKGKASVLFSLVVRMIGLYWYMATRRGWDGPPYFSMGPYLSSSTLQP
jgi:hypothetical protein